MTMRSSMKSINCNLATNQPTKRFGKNAYHKNVAISYVQGRTLAQSGNLAKLNTCLLRGYFIYA